MTGALIGSGAGLVVLAGEAWGVGGAALAGGGVGALSSAAGNATTQFTSGVFSGESAGAAFSDINLSEVGTSAAIGFGLGGAGGMIGFGLESAGEAFAANTANVEQQMSQNMWDQSTYLFENGAGQAAVDQVQNSIVDGMNAAGQTNGTVQGVLDGLENTTQTGEQVADHLLEQDQQPDDSGDDCE